MDEIPVYINLINSYSSIGTKAAVETIKRMDNKYDINAKTFLGGMSALHLACGNDKMSFEIVKSLIDKGADVNTKTWINYTPLMNVAQNGRIDIVKLLVENGADLDVQTSVNKETALMFAAKNNHVDIYYYLLEKNADVSLVNMWNQTCFDIAKENLLEISEKLLKTSF